MFFSPCGLGLASVLDVLGRDLLLNNCQLGVFAEVIVSQSKVTKNSKAMRFRVDPSISEISFLCMCACMCVLCSTSQTCGDGLQGREGSVVVQRQSLIQRELARVVVKLCFHIATARACEVT